MSGAAGVGTVTERLGVRYIDGPPVPPLAFTFVTLVADGARYETMLASAEAKGFGPGNAEFLALDNRGVNRFDGFDAIRRCLTEARGRYIVFTHDDVVFHADGAAELLAALEELGRFDPDWTLAGNAGGVRYRRGGHELALHIDDPHGLGRRVDRPVLVESLDENFFVMRRDRPVLNSYDLKGFHFYAGDLCRLSEIMGGRAYVIPFLLRHESGGKIDPAYHVARERFERKYRRYFIGRRLQLLVTQFAFGLSGMREAIGETVHSRQHFLRDYLNVPVPPGI
jgi:hypothetical protein